MKCAMYDNEDSYITWNMLLHYFVKAEDSKMWFRQHTGMRN